MMSSRFSPTFVVLILALSSPAAALAQSTDSIFLRAQRMVTEGQGEAGRALVQRELDAAPAGSARLVEALFWRASLAATAADAERDYRRIIIEFPLAPRAGDALLRMGQLEMARGERDKAIEHFRRLALEHPMHAQRPRSSYWSAQLLFQAGADRRACAALADAQQLAPASDVELRNQIEYLAPRCGTAIRDSAIGTRRSAADTAPQAPAVVEEAPSSTAPATVSAPAPVPVPVPAPAPAPATAAAPATTQPRSATTAASFTVQVAAYRTKAAAERHRTELAARGFQVRAVPLAGLWLVRIGQYATRQAAEAARVRMRAANVRGFVADMEPR